MSLSEEEEEILSEIKRIMDGLYTFRYPDAAEGLRTLADLIDQDIHDIDKVGADVQTLLAQIKSKGKITQDEIESLRELANDEKEFRSHLEKTQMILNRGGEINQAFEIIDNFEKIEESIEALEELESKLEKLEE